MGNNFLIYYFYRKTNESNWCREEFLQLKASWFEVSTLINRSYYYDAVFLAFVKIKDLILTTITIVLPIILI